jgi:hypothetical protein
LSAITGKSIKTIALGFLFTGSYERIAGKTDYRKNINVLLNIKIYIERNNKDEPVV